MSNQPWNASAMNNQPWRIWRGVRVSPLGRLSVLAAESRAGFNFPITQGGFNNNAVAASADTHNGDALDFSVHGMTEDIIADMIEALRWAGWAAWFRTTDKPLYGVRAHGFRSYHVHAVPNGWGMPSPGARRQAVAYRNGLDGLARAGYDVGPGHVRTWYKQTMPKTKTTKKKDDVLMAEISESQLRKIIRDELKEIFDTPAIPSRKGTGDDWGNTLKHNASYAAYIGAENTKKLDKLSRILEARNVSN